MLAAGHAAAQAQDASPATSDTPASSAAPPAHADPYVPPAQRQPAAGAPAAGAALRGQAMQKLKQRFDQADADGNGQLTLDEARKGGLGMVVKNFDQIDRAHSGHVSFDDIRAYLLWKRAQARQQQ